MRDTHTTNVDGSPGLAVWEFAGLLLTYWCNAKCAFCYVHSAPDRGGEMSISTAVELWRGLDELAADNGKSMRIHLAGGEPFGDWSRLAGVIRAARDAGLSPLEKIETNAFWATDDDLTRTRLELLDALGMDKLIVSADVFHQEFVPFDRVRRCVEQARRVLGRGRLIVRWWDFFQKPIDVRRADPAEKQRQYVAALAHHQDRLTGRAGDQLAPLLPRHAAEHFRRNNCVVPVLGSKHVHIDAYGHIFPGVCNGIILGRAAERSVGDVWRDLADNWRKNPVVDAVVAGGSHELTRRAQGFGYEELPGGYADKCHLCTHVRQFLVDRNIWPEFVGPPECYANARDKQDAAQAASVPLTIAGDLTRPAGSPNVSA